MGWEAGLYEYGSVFVLCMLIYGCSWVGKRVYISTEVFKLRTSGYKVFIKYVTKDVTMHLRITTMLITSSVRF